MGYGFRLGAAALGAGFYFLVTTASAAPMHGIAMHGTPKYPADFKRLDYANPAAPKGGVLRLAATGTFDTLNNNTVKGVATAGLNYIHETLLGRVWDEPFTLYGLLAENVETPDDRSWVAFTLRSQAKFSDGSPVTVDDVIFSFETIRDKGRPNSRSTYKQVAKIEKIGERGIKFTFVDASNRELPLLIGGFLPILSKKYWATHNFDETTLVPIIGSGPYVIASVDAGRGIVYRKNPNYWGKDLPLSVGHNNFDEIRYDYYRDAGISAEAFKAGEYDYRSEGDMNRWATGYDFPAAKDGRVKLEVFQHGIPSGLSAFAYNLRRPVFKDLRVRRALALMFDFEWVNANLLQGAYTRTSSMFDNSDLKPKGPPTPAELALLAPFKAQLPPEVFGEPYKPFVTDGTGADRRPIREALRLLDEAGYKVAGGKMVDPAGKPVVIEILLRSGVADDERLANAYKRDWERIGIELSARAVDSSQYQARVEQYDFDLAIRRWGATLSPGNEQANYWGTASGASPGGRNEVGVASPAVDALIAALMGTKTREDLVAAARALDRVLMWEQYTVPHYYLAGSRIAYWAKLGHPETTPVYGPVIETWWATK